MLLVGLTGGIGSGKSTVSSLLRAKGAVIVDADAITREVQAPGSPVLAALAERFGPGILAEDGSLDRAALAAIAFADDQALRDLNAIVHPAVGAEVARRIAEQQGTDRVVVLDIPLLAEGAKDGKPRYPVAAVIVVDTPVETAVERLVGQRGLAEADARARIARQASREERLRLADRVIDNGGDLPSLERQVDEVWAWLQTLPHDATPPG